MSQTVPTQHPAVVLRSHYRHLKGLLAVALIAIVSLSATVVMLSRDDDGARTTPVSYANPLEPVNYDSGAATAKPDESKVAAAISAGQGQQELGRPDESLIATAISAPQEGEQDTGRPDESRIAAAVGSR